MKCDCRQCIRDRNEGSEIIPGFFVPEENQRMVVCAICGNKRCPHATDHRNECTGSNESGQTGSVYKKYHFDADSAQKQAQSAQLATQAKYAEVS